MVFFLASARKGNKFLAAMQEIHHGAAAFFTWPRGTISSPSVSSDALHGTAAGEPEEGTCFVEKAARRGAHIVCLPELFRSLYFCQTEDHRQFALAESIPGPRRRSRATGPQTPHHDHRFHLREAVAGVYHNTAVVIGPNGRLVGRYRKMHIPDDPLYYEKFYFTPGDLGFQSFPTKRANVGALVCWDQCTPKGRASRR